MISSESLVTHMRFTLNSPSIWVFSLSLSVSDAQKRLTAPAGERLIETDRVDTVPGTQSDKDMSG